MPFDLGLTLIFVAGMLVARGLNAFIFPAIALVIAWAWHGPSS